MVYKCKVCGAFSDHRVCGKCLRKAQEELDKLIIASGVPQAEMEYRKVQAEIGEELMRGKWVKKGDK